MAKLLEHEKVLLDKVISVAGDDPSMIRDGIVKALKGISNQDGRQHLWIVLKEKATRKILDARKRAEKRYHQTA